MQLTHYTKEVQAHLLCSQIARNNLCKISSLPTLEPAGADPQPLQRCWHSKAWFQWGGTPGMSRNRSTRQGTAAGTDASPDPCSAETKSSRGAEPGPHRLHSKPIVHQRRQGHCGGMSEPRLHTHPITHSHQKT